MSGPVYGFTQQLGIAAAATPIAGERYDFESCDVALAEEFPYLGGLRGTRSRDISRVRAGNRRVSGPLRLIPTAVELSTLLPWVLGAAGSGTTFALADALPYRYVVAARDDGTNGKVFTYDHCLVNRAVFRSSQGGALSLDLDVVGVDESVGSAGTFPALSIDATTSQFLHTDTTGAFNVAATPYTPRSWSLTVDNHLDVDRFFNSQTLSTVFQAKDRTIAVEMELPYGAATAAYNTGAGGVAVAVVYTATSLGSVSLLLSLVKVAFPRDSPPTPGRDETMLRLRGQAYSSSGTKELVATLDFTP